MIAVAANPLARRDVSALLVVVIPVLGLLALGVVLTWPRTWPQVLAIDLWLLSFPHVASTFTRTAFQRSDAHEHLWLLTVLPLLALGLAAGVVWGWGHRGLNTVYFFWQTVHYVRQSRGIHRALRHATSVPVDDVCSDVVMYLSALWTLLHRCAAGPRDFFGAGLWVPTVPWWLEGSVGAAALVALVAWMTRTARAALTHDGARDQWHQVYVLGHVAMFVVSYVLVADATRGWIAINVWHNAQYLLFVWVWNRRRFARAPSPDVLLAKLSAPGREVQFFLVCVLLGALFYASIGLATAGTVMPDDPSLLSYLILVQTLNFHHYTADMVLWRRRVEPLRRA